MIIYDISKTIIKHFPAGIYILELMAICCFEVIKNSCLFNFLYDLDLFILRFGYWT